MFVKLNSLFDSDMVLLCYTHI